MAEQPMTAGEKPNDCTKRRERMLNYNNLKMRSRRRMKKKRKRRRMTWWVVVKQ